MRLTALWWWIDRWRKSTAYTDMTLEEQGAYRNLLDEAHLRGGYIPNDERILAKACGDATAWTRVKPVVMRKFVESEHGFHNETLSSVLGESVSRAAKQKRYRDGKNSPIITAIIARDGEICGICAQSVNKSLAQIDHIIPAARGGHVTAIENLQLAHPICNATKNASGAQRHASLCPAGLRNAQYNAQSNSKQSPSPSPSPSPDLSPEPRSLNRKNKLNRKIRAVPSARIPNTPEQNIRVITKIAHEVMNSNGHKADADVVEAVKQLCAKRHIAYDSTIVRKAVDSAEAQTA